MAAIGANRPQPTNLDRNDIGDADPKIEWPNANVMVVNCHFVLAKQPLKPEFVPE